MWKLNLFKVTARRTDNDIEQQRISTRIFLLVLIGMLIVHLTR